MLYRLSVQVVSLSLLLNLCGSALTTAFDLPIFLDAVGTMLAAVLLGPWIGGLVGLISNLLKGLYHTVLAIPFAPVNMVIGLLTGYLALRCGDYRRPRSPLLIGVAVAIVTPLLAAPIAAYLFGGITAHGTDKLVTALISSGNSLLSSAFWGRIPGSFLDKLLSAYLVFAILKIWTAAAAEQPSLKRDR